MTPDREKVIKGVHDARRYFEDREFVDKSVGVHIDALNDALALLKDDETRIQYLKDHIAMCKEEVERLNKEQELVRCKDCKYHGNICLDYCVNLEQNTNDDFYCAYGVNKHE